MRAVLKSVHSPDVLDLATFRPTDPDNFAVLLQAMYGPADGPGEESFDITVCSVGYLADRVNREGILPLRHYLVVREFAWPKLQAYLESYAHRVSGSSWEEIAVKLGRLGLWEFEDYRPAP